MEQKNGWMIAIIVITLYLIQLSVKVDIMCLFKF